jgi:hypothetical protein
MNWKKLGRVYDPENHKCGNWHVSHAANPVACFLNENIYRIYFSPRDAKNRSHIAYIDAEIFPKFKVVNFSKMPILYPGDPGSFDDSGISLGCIVDISGQKFIYYLGWNLGVTVPWRNSIGLAKYDKGIWLKVSRAPIIDRNEVDPYSISYPFVMKDDNIFRMWYGTNLNWSEKLEETIYVIKYAESLDGINWNRTGFISLNIKNEYEYFISRPCVIKEDGIYKMWYSYRAGPGFTTYRIGYAESRDGIKFDRLDEKAGIDVSPNPGDWDSEMICYPYVFDYKGERYMLYNGNGYGKTGFGLAVLER